MFLLHFNVYQDTFIRVNNCAFATSSAPFISRVNGIGALFHDSGGSPTVQQPDQIHDGRATGQQMEVWHRQVATVGIKPRAGGIERQQVAISHC